MDKEGNDETEVIVKARDDKAYPKFLRFENSTNTLIFRPEDEADKGEEFGFQLVVKEKNSDVILYPYFCTVKLEGEPEKSVEDV